MLDLLLLLLSFFRPVRILRWATFLSVVCVGWLMLENATLQAYLKERARRDDYRGQVQHLQQQQKQYEVELAQLKAGGFSLEQVIRERFDLRYPGEKVLEIETPATPAQTPAAAEGTERERMARAMMAHSPSDANEPLEIIHDQSGEDAKPVVKGVVRKKTAATETPETEAAPAEKSSAPEKGKSASSVKSSSRKKTSAKSTSSGATAKTRTSSKAGKTKKRAASAN